MPVFSSESFIGLTFIFKYLMRFEFIFVYDVKCKGSYPKFICVSISNLLVSLLKRSFFTLEKNLGTLDKNQHHKYECVVLESVLLWSVFLSLCQCYVVLMCTKWGFAGF